MLGVWMIHGIWGYQPFRTNPTGCVYMATNKWWGHLNISSMVPISDSFAFRQSKTLPKEADVTWGAIEPVGPEGIPPQRAHVPTLVVWLWNLGAKGSDPSINWIHAHVDYKSSWNTVLPD